MGNQDTVRALNEAFNAGDIDSWMTYVDPAMEFEDLLAPVDLEAKVAGVDNVLAALASWTEVFEEFHAEILEMRDKGDGVGGLVRWTGRSKAGPPVELTVGETWTFSDAGKLILYRSGFATIDEALASLS